MTSWLTQYNNQHNELLNCLQSKSTLSLDMIKGTIYGKSLIYMYILYVDICYSVFATLHTVYTSYCVYSVLYITHMSFICIDSFSLILFLSYTYLYMYILDIVVSLEKTCIQLLSLNTKDNKKDYLPPALEKLRGFIHSLLKYISNFTCTSEGSPESIRGIRYCRGQLYTLLSMSDVTRTNIQRCRQVSTDRGKRAAP